MLSLQRFTQVSALVTPESTRNSGVGQLELDANSAKKWYRPMICAASYHIGDATINSRNRGIAVWMVGTCSNVLVTWKKCPHFFHISAFHSLYMTAINDANDFVLKASGILRTVRFS